jgi:hypothetical protein
MVIAEIPEGDARLCAKCGQAPYGVNSQSLVYTRLMRRVASGQNEMRATCSGRGRAGGPPPVLALDMSIEGAHEKTLAMCEVIAAGEHGVPALFASSGRDRERIEFDSEFGPQAGIHECDLRRLAFRESLSLVQSGNYRVVVLIRRIFSHFATRGALKQAHPLATGGPNWPIACAFLALVAIVDRYRWRIR